MAKPIRPLMLRPALVVLLAAAPLVATVHASTDPAPRSEVNVYDGAVLASGGFLHYHPDMRFRGLGFRAFEDGYLEDAAMYFRRAARFADKASQAMLAEMHFKGIGVARDPAKAYAWMDLAAERGYPGFVALREHYWAQLDAAQRERALAVGRDIYAEFEDEVAKPRLEARMRRGKRQAVGSRLGFRGPMKIEMAGPDGLPITVTGDEYYSERFWEPRAYWAWQDEVWQAPLPGRVDVLPIRGVDDRD